MVNTPLKADEIQIMDFWIDYEREKFLFGKDPGDDPHGDGTEYWHGGTVANGKVSFSLVYLAFLKGETKRTKKELARIEGLVLKAQPTG